ncbi:hypothetical protein [Shinella sp.]|uniref:hypothetical protein n=1 Tax=Shinella sp. TaxID=1870904 RepID=UPI00289B5717|nr:hypothetical protein [Shinella sp.]
MAEAKICAVDGCGKPTFGKGFCRAHYGRLKRNGDPLLRKRLKNGEYSDWIEAHKDWSGLDCLFWPYWRDKHGYGPSRKMCEAAHGPPPTPDHQSAHSCGKGHEGCVNRNHLRWATRLENQQEMIIHGNSNRGEKNPMTPLTEADVREIRRLAMTAAHEVIGHLFGVHQSTVTRIVRRKTWGWLV